MKKSTKPVNDSPTAANPKP